ncbi:MAG: caspase family protein [Bacteroidetes bacterium]|nr:caspase family protein [Bacteroidota bacterium]
MLSALVMLQPQRDKDIVVFYYSGHGFRQPNDSRRFPFGLDL